jgi:hypothetical protein
MRYAVRTYQIDMIWMIVMRRTGCVTKIYGNVLMMQLVANISKMTKSQSIAYFIHPP